MTELDAVSKFLLFYSPDRLLLMNSRIVLSACLKKGDVIHSSTTQYQVLEYLGCGAFGTVVRCRDMSTNEKVALKMIRSTQKCEDEEVVTLHTLEELHSDMFNIVRLNDSFTYMEKHCLVFEHLDIDLHKFMKINPGQHLELKQIRPILQQVCFLH